eukprot:1183191-Amphidinium_carterae.1
MGVESRNLIALLYMLFKFQKFGILLGLFSVDLPACAGQAVVAAAAVVEARVTKPCCAVCACQGRLLTWYLKIKKSKSSQITT